MWSKFWYSVGRTTKFALTSTGGTPQKTGGGGAVQDGMSALVGLAAARLFGAGSAALKGRGMLIVGGLGVLSHLLRSRGEEPPARPRTEA